MLQWLLPLFIGAAASNSVPPVPQSVTNSIPPHSVLVSWDWNPDPTVIGYKIYYGIQSRNYTNAINAGWVTNLLVTNLNTTISNYFAATDYDTNGIESDYSVEAVSKRFPPPTNVVTFLVQILGTSNVSGPYTLVQTLPAFSVTNPVGADFIRANLLVTVTNIAK